MDGNLAMADGQLNENEHDSEPKEECEHEEEMRQGDGFVYGVCKKCGEDLY